MAALPIDEAKANDQGLFRHLQEEAEKSHRQGRARQAEVEQEWDAFVKANYAKAKELAEKALSIL